MRKKDIKQTADRAAINNLERKLATARQDTAAAKKLNAVLAAELEKKAGRVKKTPRPRKTKLNGHIRLILADTHGSHIDLASWAAVLNDLKQLPNVKSVVLLGDILEAGGFLAEHFSPIFFAEAQYSYADDVAAANKFLDELQTACPAARIHYLEGNHEGRVEKWIMQTCLRSGEDREFLRRALAPADLLHLADRGVQYYRRREFNDSCDERGVLRLGSCFFTHQTSSARSAARISLDRFAGSICYGHTHRADSAVTRKPGVGVIAAHNPGCLCALRPLWNVTSSINEWTHGYSIQLVQKSGEFLHINVPIISGKSLLAPLVQALTK